MFDRLPHRRRLATRTPVAIALAAVVGVLVAVPAFAKTPAEIEAETSPKVIGTPCTSAARACVDVNKKQAWLIKDGKILRGPVPISTGSKGKDTPTGNVFRVYKKEKEGKSSEFKLPNGQPAPMPFAVFFQDGGIAFHAGNVRTPSAGCVRLNYGDAVAFFNHLQMGDHVQVMNGPVAAAPLTPEQIAAANAYPVDTSEESESDSDSGTEPESEESDAGGDSSDQDKKEREKKKREQKEKKEREKKKREEERASSDS